TIGRAARNAEGRVLLYAYRQTKSMEKALAVTRARREKQQAYNQTHGITPTTISKKITGGVIDVLRSAKSKNLKTKLLKDQTAQPLDMVALEKKISQLKLKMKEHARDLEFEQAAKVRDEIKELSEMRLWL